MSKLALIGYGRMGKLVEQLAPGHGFEVVLRLDSSDHEIDERLREADVAIDFSTAGAVPETAERLAPLGVPLVVGTTGWHEALPRVREAVEKNGAGFLHGANFSVGVQVFYKLAEAASRLLAEETAYEGWLYEIHHSKKKDAPSGTALFLARAAAEGRGQDLDEVAVYGREGLAPRQEGEIGIHALRGGAVVGEHRLIFYSGGEEVEVVHRALSRRTFADGALRAARFAANAQPGLYSMADVLKDF